MKMIKIYKLQTCNLRMDKFEKYIDKSFYMELKDDVFIEVDQYNDFLELRDGLTAHDKSMERFDAKTNAKIKENKRIKKLPFWKRLTNNF